MTKKVTRKKPSKATVKGKVKVNDVKRKVRKKIKNMKLKSPKRTIAPRTKRKTTTTRKKQ
jgi:hypothetical protein